MQGLRPSVKIKIPTEEKKKKMDDKELKKRAHPLSSTSK